MSSIRNIKVSAKVSNLCLNTVSLKLLNSKVAQKHFSNYITFQHTYTYIVFKNSKDLSNHVNITKLKCENDIESALQLLTNLLGCHIITWKIDNIIATSFLQQKLDLLQIINQKIFPRVKYNSEQFPGLFVKFDCGTVILFHSGKIVIVGCKSESEIWTLSEIVSTKLKQLTLERDTQSA